MPFRDLDAYIKQARRANSDRELFSCSEAAARQLGLPWLAIVQSMAFFQPGGRYFRMDNFQSWGDVFVAEGYYRDDPALLAALSRHRSSSMRALMNTRPRPLSLPITGGQV